MWIFRGWHDCKVSEVWRWRQSDLVHLSDHICLDIGLQGVGRPARVRKIRGKDKA